MNIERSSASASRSFPILFAATLRCSRFFFVWMAALFVLMGLAAASWAGMKPGSAGVPPAALRAVAPVNRTVSPRGIQYAPNGRAILDHRLMRAGALIRPQIGATATATPIPGAVQTFDVFNPGPSFRPLVGYSNPNGSLSNDPTLPPVYAAGLTPTNLTPVWSQDETFLVFSSNRNQLGGLNTDATDGVSSRYHLWAISINGGQAFQITTSTGPAGGGEFFPALSSGNNGELAFTSDAQTPGVNNLYVIQNFSYSTVVLGNIVNVSQNTAITSITNVAGTGFDQVQRPTISPTDGNVVVFSARSTAGTYTGHFHLYFLNLTTGGYDPTNNSLPAKLTDGPADDTDPAYSNDGQFIAFASTGNSLTTQPQTSGGFSSSPNQSQTLTHAAGGTTIASNRSLFILSGGSNASGFGTGIAPNIGTTAAPVYGPITLAGADNFGPAWSYSAPNQYTNPAPGFDYLAFGRGQNQLAPHDIYYLQTVRSTTAQGETGRSYEASATPAPASTPVYQIDAGSSFGSGSGTFNIGDFQNGGGGLSFVAGGIQETNTLTFNTVNDPGTPPQIYNTDRLGSTTNGGNNSFVYTLPNLTPAAKYTVRLHFADPKDTLAGQRVFNVTITGNNGQVNRQVDIVQLAQQNPGQIGGLVQNSGGTAIAGATLTVTDYNTGAAVATVPTPVTSAGTTTLGPDNAQENYTASVVSSPATDAYVITATAPGFGRESQIVHVSSSAFARADFTLASSAAGATATISGTVQDGGGNTLANTPVLVSQFNAANNPLAFGNTAFPTSGAAQVVTNGSGHFSVTVPAATAGAGGTAYQVTVSPAYSGTSSYATQTQNVTATAGATSNLSFTLQSGAAVGDVIGLASDKTSGLPIAGAVLQLRQSNVTSAIVFTRGTITSFGNPTGDGNPENYVGFVPVGAYQANFSSYQATPPQPAPVTVVNNPGPQPPLNEAVRADAQFVSLNPASTGGNTAVVLSFPGIIATSVPTANPPANAGKITISFTPVSGDPPIVQGIEAISDPAAATSSSFGGDAGTPAASAPQTLDALGGTNGAGTTGLITLNWAPVQYAVAYNIYRSPQANSGIVYPTATNQPNNGGSGLEGNIPYLTNIPGTTFPDTNVTVGDEYSYQVTAVLQEVVTAENSSTNAAIKLNTDDNAGETSTTGNVYDDIYPTWSPFHSIFSIAYSSNRSVSYNDPVTGLPVEVAISLPRNSTVNEATGAAPYNIGANYAGIMESQVLNLDPPTLLRFSGTETVHIQPLGSNPVTGVPTKYGINLTGGKTVTMTVRLSDREAGIDDNNVYVQIKDPDSKYQDNPRRDGVRLEHKVFAKDPNYLSQTNQPANDLSTGSASDLLSIDGPGINGGGLPSLQYSWPTYAVNQFEYPRGALGGIYNATTTHIYIGKTGGGNNQNISEDNRKPPAVYSQFPGDDPNLFIARGPEYECQFVNSNYANYGTVGADTAVTDYGTPYYLAGVDDQVPFSGDVNTPRTEWLHLTRVPAAQQDNLGGVLYTANWTTPITGSDFFLDVIAYDKARFPNLPAGTSVFSGRQTNWRIYDNVGGFSTNATIDSNDILVVSDYALGQKFAGTTFSGSNGNLNLVPKIYGAESYITDEDVNTLPDTQFAGYPLYIDNTIRNYGPFLQSFSAIGLRTLNGLGVGSYSDPVTESFGQGNTVDGVPYDVSQRYSIWRILARGPVPQSLLSTYLPLPKPQPGVFDLQGPVAYQNIPAASVMSAPRCVVWLSPFTGDLLTDPGALDDPGSFNIPGQPNRSSTQTILRNFVQAGGRLFITGQDVGSGLTLGGTVSNAPGGFLSDVLNATLASANAGSNTLVGSANRITGDPGYDSLVGGVYPTIVGTYLTGFRIPLPENNYPYLDRMILGNAVQSDGSLDQRDIGSELTLPSGASLLGQIDTLTPMNGAQTALTYGAGGPVAMVFHDDPYKGAAAPTLPNGGTGSRVVYGAFGLEAMSSDVYASEGADPAFPFSVAPAGPRNPRPEILHNIVCYLRTGTVSGRVTQTAGTGQGAGQGIANVTVYLQPASGVAPPTRATFSATTDTGTNAGNFTIFGVEPGQYKIAAYKAGYTDAVANVGNNFVVEGDVNIASQALTISPLPPGHIAGTVTDPAGNPIPNAQVNFTSRDQTVTVNGLTFGGTNPATPTSPSGSYFLPSVPPTEYDTATAISPNNPNGQPEYMNAAAPQPPFNTATAPPYNTKVTVVASTTTQPVNFVLTPILATITGTVTNSVTGALLPGATVSLYDSTGTTAIPGVSVVTDVNGAYILSNVPASTTATTYTLKVSAPGFANNSATTAPVYLGSTITQPAIALMPIPPGSIQVVVNYSTGGPVANAVVTYSAPGGAPQTGTTDSTGTLIIANVPPATYTVSAVGPNNTTRNVPTTTAAPAQQVVVSSGAQASATFVVALIPPSFSGTVTSGATPPAALGSVTITVTDGTGAVVATTTTATDGTYNTGALPPGTYTVTASRAGYASASTAATAVQNGDALTGINLTLTAVPPGSITGTVLDNNTLPVVGAKVTFNSTDGTVVGLTATTNASGVYVIPPPPAAGNVPASSYTGSAVGPNNDTATPEYGAGTPQTITVNPNSSATANFVLPVILASVSGTVTDVQTGGAVAGATVTLTGPTGTAVGTPVVTGANGAYSFTGILATQTLSNYTLTVTAPSYTAGTVTVGLELGDAKTVPIPLNEQATLYGLVTDGSPDAAGQPLAGVTLTVTNAAGTVVATVPAAVVTQSATTVGADGQPANYLATLLPGVYTITASKAGFNSLASTSVTLTNAAPKRVNFALVSSIGTIGGLVTNLNDTGLVAGATVTLVPTGATTGVTFTTNGSSSAGPDGSPINYTGQLAQGTYTATVTKGSRASAPVQVTIQGGTFNRLDFKGANGIPALHQFAAGLQFVSTPYDYSALGFNGLFGPLNTAMTGQTPNGNRSNVAVWNPLTGAYALDPTPPADAPRPGIGYWVNLANPTAVTQQGASPTSAFVAVPLGQGWNQIGVPSASAAGIPITHLMFDNGNGGMISYTQAGSSQYNLTKYPLYAYSGGAYQALGTGGTLQPWNGYWIYVNAAATLEIPTQ